MWSTVELREIRVFLTLCEELHFARTAERLQLTPSRVSQIVRELEDKLGGQLVQRTSRQVSLTYLGERLQAEIGAPYGELGQGLERVAAACREIAGTLRVGEFWAAGGPSFLKIIAAFEASHPACKVAVTEPPVADPLGPLRRAELDLLAVRLPLSQPDIVVGPVLSREPRVLAVARDHPLAGHEAVTLEDVADYQVGRFDYMPRELVAEMIPFETPSGRKIPRMREELYTLGELASQIALGRIVHPTVPPFAKFTGERPEIVYIPLVGLPPSKTGLVWRRDNKDPRVRAFARVAEEIVAAEAGATEPAGAVG